MDRFGRSSRANNELWRYNQVGREGVDPLYGGFLGGLSWPPRSYTCSFCKREFRSAQALGGHMNVHRRDRARLRQSPPWDTSIPNPNPNPSPNLHLPDGSKPNIPNLNFAPPPNSTTNIDAKFCPATYTFSSLLSPLSFPRVSSSEPRCSNRDELSPVEVAKELFGAGRSKDLMVEKNGGAKEEVVGLDMEVTMCSDLEDDMMHFPMHGLVIFSFKPLMN
uniref:C2H2-type domain-containing protein n=1 Tax=Ananas comosus var. bracteatus TaxID=296719 RepID=A0A6V7QLI0_ANACO|nr:unnamed protein product [Ananas comosus var. bracteatus]